ncbi:type VI secretion system baseplate subunit TssG [uncultured Shewanella sp.]|uniref:type VI secretion system baseplate subunit TssG n=1 Tax=uncultured Shewanella sp. TaxID=173975 RepID=UPI0026051971|nr:type VI secretion system baseplate subunit TssG [uncultured Shewanella sp.]
MLVTPLNGNPHEYEYIQVKRFLENIEPSDYSNRKILTYSGQFCDFSYGEVKIVFQKNNNWIIKVNLPSLLGYYFTLPEMFYSLTLRTYFDDDDSMIDFFNIFENRHFELLFKSSCKNNLALNYEEEIRGAKKGKRYLSGLLGVIGGSLPQYGGVMSLKSSHAKVIKNILEDYFDIKFKIYSDVPDYIPLVSDTCSKVGVENSNLGVSLLLGKSCVIFGNKMVVEIEAENEENFQQLRTDIKLKDKIEMVISEYMATPIVISIVIKTKALFMPRIILGKNDTSKLGYSCFMASEEDFIYYKVK